MIIVPFKPEHLANIMLQPSQMVFQPTLQDPQYGQMLATAGPAYAAVEGDAVFACAGLIPQWENRAVAWALISSAAGRHFTIIHRAVLRTFELHPFRRIETGVNADFEQGHRWLRMLGFQREGRMRAYTPDGHDCDLYARVTCKH